MQEYWFSSGYIKLAKTLYIISKTLFNPIFLWKSLKIKISLEHFHFYLYNKNTLNSITFVLVLIQPLLIIYQPLYWASIVLNTIYTLEQWPLSSCVRSTLLNKFKLVYGPFEQSNIQFLPRPASQDLNVTELINS